MVEILCNEDLQVLNSQLIRFEISEEEYVERALPILSMSFETSEQTQCLFRILKCIDQQPLSKEYFGPLRDVLLNIQTT